MKTRQSCISESFKAIMTNRAHSEANLPRPVALVPVAKPRGKMTSPPSQTTPHHYANQNENRNQNTTNNQIANHHSGLFHYEIFFLFTSKLRLGSETFRRLFIKITCCWKDWSFVAWNLVLIEKQRHQIINEQRDWFDF